MSSLRSEWFARNARNGRLIVNITVRRLRSRIMDPVYAKQNRRRPYKFFQQRYEGTFVARAAATGTSADQVLRTLWCFWTDNNEMSDLRSANLNRLREANADLDVVLVTPENLGEYLVDGMAIHPSYERLSAVHRADYLRCYFMHHYGGAYCDVKAPRHPALAALESLELDSDSWVVGYREVSSGLCAQLPGALGRDVRRYHRQLIGCCAFAMRPRTPFTTEWYAEVQRRMDRLAPPLSTCPGNLRGTNAGYPVRWTQLLGEVIHPLCLKHSGHILYNEDLMPVLVDYQ